MAVAAAIVGGALAVGGSVAGAIATGKEAKNQGRRAASARKRMDWIEDNRQEVINPYSNMDSVTDLATDLQNTMSNPYENLGVATQAAKFQAEEADMALANTLDTMLATGASAGGATALAQAALQSKRGVSASIESQEATNEKLRAQGDAELQKRQSAEAVRMQNIALQDELRLQSAEAQGRAYEFESEEQRDENQLSRLAGQQQQAQAAQSAARAGQASMLGGLASMGGNLLSGAIASGGLKSGG